MINDKHAGLPDGASISVEYKGVNLHSQGGHILLLKLA